MTATEAKLFRFIGREVWRDSEACASEVLEYVLEIQARHLGEEFLRFVKNTGRPGPRI